MASDLLVKSMARGRVVVQKARHVGGEVGVYFHDRRLAPVMISGDKPVVLTDMAGVTAQAVGRSNVASLVAQHVLEIVG
jgi:hypothetical protein